MLSNVNVNVNVNAEIQPLTMTHLKANVTNVDSIVIPENINRKYLLIANNTNTDMIINLGNEILGYVGIPLNSGGNFQITKDYLFIGNVHAIHKLEGETKQLDITEGE